MHTRIETNKQSTSLSSSLFRESGVTFVGHSRNGYLFENKIMGCNECIVIFIGFHYNRMSIFF